MNTFLCSQFCRFLFVLAFLPFRSRTKAKKSLSASYKLHFFSFIIVSHAKWNDNNSFGNNCIITAMQMWKTSAAHAAFDPTAAWKNMVCAVHAFIFSLFSCLFVHVNPFEFKAVIQLYIWPVEIAAHWIVSPASHGTIETRVLLLHKSHRQFEHPLSSQVASYCDLN